MCQRLVVMVRRSIFGSPGSILSTIVLAIVGILGPWASRESHADVSRDRFRAVVEFVRSTFPALGKDTELWYLANAEGKYEPFAVQTLGLFVGPAAELERVRAVNGGEVHDGFFLSPYPSL